MSDKALDKLLETALRNLNQTNKYEEYLNYLHSEWYYTCEDLILAKANKEIWSNLRLPGRLKIELANLMDNSIQSTSLIIKDDDNECNIDDLRIDTIHLKDHDDRIDEEVNNQWICCVSNEHNCYYYYNTMTKESVWDPPEGNIFTEVFQYSDDQQQWIITNTNYDIIDSNHDYSELSYDNQYHTGNNSEIDLVSNDDRIVIVENDDKTKDAFIRNHSIHERGRLDEKKVFTRPRILTRALSAATTTTTTTTTSKASHHNDIEEKVVQNHPNLSRIIHNSNNRYSYSTDEEKGELSPVSATSADKVLIKNNYSSRIRQQKGISNTIQVIAASSKENNTNREYYGQGGWVYSAKDTENTDAAWQEQCDEEESVLSLAVSHGEILPVKSASINPNPSKNLYPCTNPRSAYDTVPGYYGYGYEGSYGVYLDSEPSAPYMQDPFFEHEEAYSSIMSATATAMAEPFEASEAGNYLVVEVSSPGKRPELFLDGTDPYPMMASNDQLFELAMGSSSPLEESGNLSTTIQSYSNHHNNNNSNNWPATPTNNNSNVDSSYDPNNDHYKNVPKRKKIGKLFRMNLFGKNVNPKVPLTPPPSSASPILSNTNKNMVQQNNSNKLAFKIKPVPKNLDSNLIDRTEIPSSSSPRNEPIVNDYDYYNHHYHSNVAISSSNTNLLDTGILNSSSSRNNSSRQAIATMGSNNNSSSNNNNKQMIGTVVHDGHLSSNNKQIIGTVVRDGHLSRVQRLMDLGFKETEVGMALQLCEDHYENAKMMLIENRKALISSKNKDVSLK